MQLSLASEVPGVGVGHLLGGGVASFLELPAEAPPTPWHYRFHPPSQSVLQGVTDPGAESGPLPSWWAGGGRADRPPGPGTAACSLSPVPPIPSAPPICFLPAPTQAGEEGLGLARGWGDIRPWRGGPEGDLCRAR